MANNTHANLPEAQLHEAKGFSTAANSTVLTKNAAGARAWVSYGSFLVKGHTADITGDNATTLFTITHNLGTRKVHVSVIHSTTYKDVVTENIRTTTNAVTVDFKGFTPTGTDVYHVVITGMV